MARISALVLGTTLLIGGPSPTVAQDKPDQAAPVQVIVAEVRRQPLSDRVEALGTARANESVVLTTRVAETVRKMHFEDGDRVKAGAILVELTSDEEGAQLEEAMARVREARQQHKRVRELAQRSQAAQSQLDERRRELETVEAQLQAIEARLADLLVLAPFDGVLGLRQISPGAFVQPGTVITTLNDISTIKLDFSVPATYLEVLRPGLRVQAQARALQGRVFEGAVSFVNTEVDPVTRSVLARALLPNDSGLLRPGMLMTVTLEKDPREALMIPEAALIPRGRESFVLAVGTGNDSQAVRKQVRLGARLPGFVEVLGGLAEGELVITHGTLRVRPGQRVAIRAVDAGGEPLEQLLDQRRPIADAGAGP